MNRLLLVTRPFAEPAAGALFFTLWVVAEAGRMGLVSLGERHLTWLATLGVVSVGIALVRIAPLVSVALPGVVLIAQAVYPPARFTENSSPAYLGFAIIAVGLVAYVPTRLRPAMYWLLGGYTVAVPLLLTVPWFGPIIGRAIPYGAPQALLNFSMVFGVATFVAAIAWIVGTVLHRWEVRPAPSPPPTSEATVKSHISRILAKLEVASRARLVAYAWEHELLGR